MATKVWLQNNSIDFEERNVSTNHEYLEELVQQGYRTTPVVVKGNRVVVGYSPAVLAKTFGA
jgi:glutaredoxin|tara:strand:+ start:3633 stop:3818 length:186 start_codon:yes stop_codon:yes gene_type:complete